MLHIVNFVGSHLKSSKFVVNLNKNDKQSRLFTFIIRKPSVNSKLVI